MSAVVLDTHTLIWYILEPEKLSEPAFNALEQATDDGEIVHLSAISIVEICYLIDKVRLSETVLAVCWARSPRKTQQLPLFLWIWRLVWQYGKLTERLFLICPIVLSPPLLFI